MSSRKSDADVMKKMTHLKSHLQDYHNQLIAISDRKKQFLEEENALVSKLLCGVSNLIENILDEIS